MITKFTILTMIASTSTAMAMDTTEFAQTPAARVYDAEILKKDNTSCDGSSSSIYSAFQDCAKLPKMDEAVALKSAQPQISELFVVKHDYSANIQEILAQKAAFDHDLLPGSIPPLYLKKSDYSSFFSSSWGSTLNLFTQKQNKAFYLVPMAMFVLGHINAHNK